MFHKLALPGQQKGAIRAILQSVSNVANLSFVEVAESSKGVGTLRFGESATVITATGYYPGSSSQSGDARFNVVDYNSPTKGSYAYFNMMHETGHTLGLDHGHEGRAALPANRDTVEYSVMTYRSYEGGPADNYSVRDGHFPRSFMLSDIAALQHMYGADYSTNSGSTTYRWSPTTGELTINASRHGISPANIILETIWDGGGTDTYDFSAYTTALRVDLNPGAWTTTSSAQLAHLGNGHSARGNIANAYLHQGNTASLIENAKGGSGHDRLTGNMVNNTLDGGSGNDTLVGGAGKDVLSGGSGADQFVFNSACGSSNIDSIKDFRPDSDRLCLEDTIFNKVGSWLTEGEFYAKGGVTKAHDKGDRIIFDTDSGRLYYDDDGTGAHKAIHFATLSNKPALEHTDFAIV